MTIEYSANLARRTDIPALAETALEAIVATGLFERGAVRVRAFESAAYAIADRLPDNAFVDMVLRIGAGRTPDEKKRAGDAVYKAVSALLTPLFGTPHFALSFEIREIDPVLSWKTNAMHARLRSQKSEE